MPSGEVLMMVRQSCSCSARACSAFLRSVMSVASDNTSRGCPGRSGSQELNHSQVEMAQTASYLPACG